MSKKEPKTPQTEETPTETPVNDEVDASAEPMTQAERNALLGQLQEKDQTVSALETELAEAKDKYLRLVAEYDNFRRRSQKEKEGIYTEATFDVLSGILPVIDNLERAAVAGGDAEQVTKGLEMILRSVREMLQKQSVEAYGAVGDSFDPNLHHAVMHDEDPEKPEGYISDVFMKGYKKGDRVLRYAMVKTLN